MSSHREAPEISKDPVADSADLYAFVSPDNPSTVTIIANYVPLQQPAGGPNFYEFGDDVLYEVHIDNDGDALADITYQFRFNTVLTDTGAHDLFLYNTGQIMHLSDTTWNRKQFYSVTRVDKKGRTFLPRTWRAHRATSERTRSPTTHRSPPRRSTRSARAATSSPANVPTASTSTSGRSSTSATSGLSSPTSSSRARRWPASTPSRGSTSTASRSRCRSGN